MTMAEHDDRLPCGVDVGDLVDQVAEDRPPADRSHQESCPYCRAALDELATLWTEVRELAREEVAPSGDLLATIMRRVRRERLAGARLPPEQVVPRLVHHARLQGPRGATKIADSVIAALIERAALATPGVRSLRRPDPVGRATRFLGGRLGDGLALLVEGDEVSLEIGLVVEFGFAIPELVAAVRARVEHEVERLAGLRIASLEIAVVDILDS